jgi:hypothetical protein
MSSQRISWPLKQKRVYADEVARWAGVVDHVGAYASGLLKKHGVRDHLFRDRDNYSHFGPSVLPCSSFLGSLKNVERTYVQYAMRRRRSVYDASVIIDTASIMKDIIDVSLEIIKGSGPDFFWELDDSEAAEAIKQLTECFDILNAVIEEYKECISNKHVHVEASAALKGKRSSMMQKLYQISSVFTRMWAH